MGTRREYDSRRSFLETLINYLMQLNLISEESGQEKLDELAERKEEETDTTNEFKPTSQGLIFLLLTVLLPLALNNYCSN